MTLKSKCSRVSETKSLGFIVYHIPSAVKRSEQGLAGLHAHQNMETVFTHLNFSELCLARRGSPSNNFFFFFFGRGREGGEEGREQKFNVICHNSLLNYFQFQNEKTNYPSLLYSTVTQYLSKFSSAHVT